LSRKILVLVLSIITGGSCFFRKSWIHDTKRFSKSIYLFCWQPFWFSFVFSGWFVNFAWYVESDSDSLSCISSNADDSLVIKCYLVLIELVTFSALVALPFTVIWFLLFSIRNFFTALQAQINTIRINAAIL
jgi:hypothetical protein